MKSSEILSFPSHCHPPPRCHPKPRNSSWVLCLISTIYMTNLNVIDPILKTAKNPTPVCQYFTSDRLAAEQGGHVCTDFVVQQKQSLGGLTAFALTYQKWHKSSTSNTGRPSLHTPSTACTAISTNLVFNFLCIKLLNLRCQPRGDRPQLPGAAAPSDWEGGCYGSIQILWVKLLLQDYRMRFLRTKVFPETQSGPKKISPKYGIFLSEQTQPL